MMLNYQIVISVFDKDLHVHAKKFLNNEIREIRPSILSGEELVASKSIKGKNATEDAYKFVGLVLGYISKSKELVEQ